MNDKTDERINGCRMVELKSPLTGSIDHCQGYATAFALTAVASTLSVAITVERVTRLPQPQPPMTGSIDRCQGYAPQPLTGQRRRQLRKEFCEDTHPLHPALHTGLFILNSYGVASTVPPFHRFFLIFFHPKSTTY